MELQAHSVEEMPVTVLSVLTLMISKPYLYL